MKFSVWPNPSRPPAEVLDLARMADDDGWHCFWYADHYMNNTGDESFKAGPVHEAWSILPAVAAATSRVRLGPLVAPTSVHHPALLANRAATIDQLSNGRFVLGLGAGWQINEHRAYGIELDAPGARVSRFEESIQVVRSLLDNETTNFDGDFYRFTDAPCEPRPIQATLPILVGTGSPRMLRITCRHAQEWNTWGAPTLAAERRADFDTACDAVDTDPASMHTSVQALVMMTEDQAIIDGAMAGPMGERMIAGSDQHIVEQLGTYAATGFDEFILFDGTLGATHEERMNSYRRFRTDIASQLG
jgi:alkanesulfonate monooxygenase SsuD/methylene tetrahydromethanopterin reductase-like flavin-dependent oxidoreductase (luciferase family)